MTDAITTDDGINAALQINQAHGTKIDAANAIRVIADQVRNGIATDAGRAQSAVTKASRYSQEKVSKMAGRAQGAVDGVIADVGNTIRGTIENAIAPLIELGVELPSERQIQEVKRQLVTQQTGQIKPTANGSCNAPATCNVHLLPESERGQYDTLGLRPGGIYLVYPHGPQVCAGEPLPQVIRVFQNWWTAELTCRLLNDCRFSIQRIIPYWRAIDAVQLASGNLGAWMKPLCDNFFVAAQAYLQSVGSQVAGKPGPVGTVSGGTGTLPPGYGWWCLPDGTRRIIPLDSEITPPGNWCT